MPKAKNLPKSNGTEKPGPGRPKGSKNKTPRDLVEKVLKIEADLAENNKGLADQAKAHPKWFLENFIKPLLPKNMDISSDTEIKIIVKDRF